MEMEQLKDKGRLALSCVRQNPGEFFVCAAAAGALFLAMAGAIVYIDTPEFREKVEREAKRYCLARGIEDAEKCKEYRIREETLMRLMSDRGW